jgi:hypothetical protein
VTGNYGFYFLRLNASTFAIDHTTGYVFGADYTFQGFRHKPACLPAADNEYPAGGSQAKGIAFYLNGSAGGIIANRRPHDIWRENPLDTSFNYL